MTKVKEARIRWKSKIDNHYHRKTTNIRDVLYIAEELLSIGIPCTIAPIVKKPKILIPDQDAL